MGRISRNIVGLPCGANLVIPPNLTITHRRRIWQPTFIFILFKELSTFLFLILPVSRYSVSNKNSIYSLLFKQADENPFIDRSLEWRSANGGVGHWKEENCDSKLNLQILISPPEKRSESLSTRSGDEYSSYEWTQYTRSTTVFSAPVRGSSGLFHRKTLPVTSPWQPRINLCHSPRVH